jgi:hypothetical protein
MADRWDITGDTWSLTWVDVWVCQKMNYIVTVHLFISSILRQSQWEAWWLTIIFRGFHVLRQTTVFFVASLQSICPQIQYFNMSFMKFGERLLEARQHVTTWEILKFIRFPGSFIIHFFLQLMMFNPTVAWSKILVVESSSFLGSYSVMVKT